MLHRDFPDHPSPDGVPSERLLPGECSDAGSLPAHEAAGFLHISAATLRSWEQEFGFPASMESTHPDPNYRMTELLALQDALADALSITSAVHTARQTIERAI
jgi:hypothetical protein